MLGRLPREVNAGRGYYALRGKCYTPTPAGYARAEPGCPSTRSGECGRAGAGAGSGNRGAGVGVARGSMSVTACFRQLSPNLLGLDLNWQR